MAERLMKPQVNTLTSFYKNKAQKAVKDWVCIKADNLIILRYSENVWIEGRQQIFRIFMIENRKKKTIVDQTCLYGKKKNSSAIRQQ